MATAVTYAWRTSPTSKPTLKTPSLYPMAGSSSSASASRPKKIKCPGCLSDADETLDIGCPVRPCVVARGLVNCAYCEAYVCEKLQERLVRFESMQEKSPEPISKLEWQLFILPYENQVRLVELRSRLGRKDD